MGHNARTVAFAALSNPMRLALIDLVSRGGLYRIRVGYDGSLTHSHATMVALAKRGLCTLKPRAGCMGAAETSKAGIKVIIDEFRGDHPALVDCDALGRRKR
jgi:hypothetical protein